MGTGKGRNKRVNLFNKKKKIKDKTSKERTIYSGIPEIDSLIDDLSVNYDLDKLGRNKRVNLSNKKKTSKKRNVYSGIPEIDSLIDDFFINYDPRDLGCNLNDLKIGKVAHNRCGDAATNFGHFAEKNASSKIKVLDSFGTVLDTDDWGYKDRPTRGIGGHVCTVLLYEGMHYMIDFTAAQYGYKEFPMIQRTKKLTITDEHRLTSGGNWERNWDGREVNVKLAAPASEKEIAWRDANPQADWRYE